MEKIWKKIESWLEKNAPDQFAALEPGADAAAVKKAEQAMSCELPKDVAESYRIHDGMRAGVGPLIDDWRLLSLAMMVKEWQGLKKVADAGTFADMDAKPDVQIKPGWWNPRWIPICSNNSGDFLCVDLDPQRTGKSGQIITYLHADPARKLTAKNLTSLLKQFAADLAAGKYKVDGEWLTRIE